jgi:transcriptional antiterminator RfaH
MQRSRKQDFSLFLPLIKEKRVWSDRIKTVLVPLLSSYVFIKTTKQFFPQIYPLPGFVKFVAFEGKPCTIREKEIELMEKIVAHGFQVLPATRCRVGDWVRINRGPLTGAGKAV